MVAKTHIGHVRTAAHVHIFFMMIQPGTIVAADIFVEDSHFIILAPRDKRIARLLPADFFLDNVVIFFGQFVHALFQPVEIVLGQGMIEINIIIKAFLDDRADSHFSIRPQLLNGVPQ
ncbi:hypothetical protein SODG_002216 [Sodalis praecaptivus]